jgi:hypothetical protein
MCRVFIREVNALIISIPCGGGFEYLYLALRVVGGGENGSLESETVKYGAGEYQQQL